MMPSKEEFRKMKRDPRPARNGWVPSTDLDALGHCSECGCAFVGDRRATMCADCAYADPNQNEDDIPQCTKCGRTYSLEPHCEPTEFCNDCAHDAVGEMRAELARLRAENERLRKALEPFAEKATSFDAYSNQTWIDGDIIVAVKLNDCRAAKAALEGER